MKTDRWLKGLATWPRLDRTISPLTTLMKSTTARSYFNSNLRENKMTCATFSQWSTTQLIWVYSPGKSTTSRVWVHQRQGITRKLANLSTSLSFRLTKPRRHSIKALIEMARALRYRPTHRNPSLSTEVRSLPLSAKGRFLRPRWITHSARLRSWMSTNGLAMISIRQVSVR